MILEYRDILGQKNHKIKKNKKSAKFIKIFELYQVFIHTFLSQNVPIPQNHTIPTRNKSIFTPSTNFYHFPNLSVKIVSICFFPSSGKHQSHHFPGCITYINSLLRSILHSFHFSNLLHMYQAKSLKWLVVGSIFNIDFFDLRFIYNHYLQAQNVLTDELLQNC